MPCISSSAQGPRAYLGRGSRQSLIVSGNARSGPTSHPVWRSVDLELVRFVVAHLSQSWAGHFGALWWYRGGKNALHATLRSCCRRGREYAVTNYDVIVQA